MNYNEIKNNSIDNSVKKKLTDNIDIDKKIDEKHDIIFPKDINDIDVDIDKRIIPKEPFYVPNDINPIEQQNIPDVTIPKEPHYLPDEIVIEEPFDIQDTEPLFYKTFIDIDRNFKFGFNIYDEDVSKALEPFSIDNWSKIDTEARKEVVNNFHNVLCDKLGIYDNPFLNFEYIDDDTIGLFDNEKNTVTLSPSLIYNYDPSELVKTLAHEDRHAYQYMKAKNPVDDEGRIFAYNFNNYIEPFTMEDIQNQFNDYLNQYIESDANAFSDMFNLRNVL